MTPVVRMQLSRNIFYHLYNLILRLFTRKEKKPYVTHEKVVLENEVIVEADASEDEDVVILPEEAAGGGVLEERAPVNPEEEQLRKLIQEAIITREIRHLAVHCTGTSIHATVAGIIDYWQDALGWRNPGYHLVFPHQGGFTYVHDFNLLSNGVRHFNAHAINISTIGGLDAQGQIADTMSEAQHRIVEITIEEFIKRFPDIVVVGHRGFPRVNKACPCYDVDEKYPQFAPNVRRRV